MGWCQSIGVLLLIAMVRATEADGAGCDCGNIRASKYPGREVCGVDGLKYGSACLAWCQGIVVAENEACGPLFALAVGGEPGEFLDWGVITRFADKGMKYLGEEADELAGGQGHAPQQGVEHAVIVDMLLNEDGAVYGKPMAQETIEAWMASDLPRTRPDPGVHSRRRLSLSQAFIAYDSIYSDNFKDDRSPVPNTNSDPWRRIGVVEPSSCTGVLIAENKVLTAAHCIVYPTTNGILPKIRFAPAKNNDRRPYGTLSSRFSRVLSCYSTSYDGACDIGVITLSSSVGNTVGWFDVGSECTGQPVNLTIAGYPGEKDLRTMWFEVCGENEIICENSPRILQLECDVSGGMSGSPIWDDQGKIRGILANWSFRNGNTAAQITPEVQSIVQAWIDE